MVYVRKTNLEGLLRAPFVALDCALIIALVERWRPETHSFHLGPGKKTVTLQVVEVILGLPVKGEAVTESSDLKDIQQFCMRLLGKAPSKSNNEFTGQKVTMKWLAQFDGQINEGDSEEVVKQKAQGFLLRMLGGGYGCNDPATDLDLGVVAHVITSTSREAIFSSRWYDMFIAPDLAQSMLGHYRHALDIMKPDEVEWMPYKPKLLDALPPYCRAEMAIWRASVPFICFSYVEMHQPE
ncbi:hypothetical protein Vadar_029456 [Vaccinium darrowii]|uniref:Uncharacterized protein n=1 Tax=Vaccinium darrowii TaxID=229202 RepID=A0ACB7YHZ6_9ERIC|nr:hypothetical protein Vadar_029456 [Vaccinium darrowii]